MIDKRKLLIRILDENPYPSWTNEQLADYLIDNGVEVKRFKEDLVMKTWKIPVCWTMMGTINVEADTLEEAIEIARDDEGVIPIPDNGDFLSGSWEVDCADVDYLREWYNENQKDNIKE